MEYIQDIVLAFILTLGCMILAGILKERKQYILRLASDLVQRTETAVQGSGMGVEKKRIVLMQLESMNIKVTVWLSAMIDDIVAALNEKRAWITENAKDGLPDEARLTE